MKLRNPFRRLTDEEVIANARKSVEWCARYRRRLVALYFGVAILLTVLVCFAIYMVDRLFAQPLQNRGPGILGFVAGLAIGSSLGFAIIQAFHYFVEGHRFFTKRLPQEELLVRYHDTLEKVRTELRELRSASTDDNSSE